MPRQSAGPALQNAVAGEGRTSSSVLMTQGWALLIASGGKGSDGVSGVGLKLFMFWSSPGSAGLAGVNRHTQLPIALR